jgi:hypothetical protein
MNVRSTEGPDVALRRFLMAGSRQVTGVASRDQDETLQSDRSRQNETTAFGTDQASSETRGLPSGQHERQPAHHHDRHRGAPKDGRQADTGVLEGTGPNAAMP